ncbi:MAG TPA: hypothetical protein VJC06_00210 [Candidatus Paceibacterota bacterium]
MVKNGKTTLEKLEGLVGVVARNVADIKDKMATKDDIKGLEFKMEDTERRLSTKIDAVDEKLDALEEVDIRGLQRRVFVLEKDVKQIKHRNV